MLTESNAIAHFVANEQLRGKTSLEQAKVAQWLSFAESELLPSSCAWVFPLIGIVPYENAAVARATKEVEVLFNVLNKELLSKTYLAGERITLADIVVFSNLLYLYQYVVDEQFRKPYSSLNRWFLTLLNQPQFSSVLKDFKVCEKALTAETRLTAAPKSAAVQKEQQPAKQTEKPKEKKQPAAKKAKEVEPVEELDAADLALALEPKSKDPFDSLPKGTFVIDEFKRSYSNEDESVSIPFFWTKFDPVNYSIWYGEYKYPEELSKVFMSCNLISGMYQRLDKMRKQAFASVCLFGKDNDSTISGIWVWRGQELAFELSPDWGIDYSSYEWKKLDAASDETKALVKQYFSWTGTDKSGRSFNQGKIFK